MANSRYLGYPFTIDARQLMANAFNYLKTKIPGWQPSEGQVDVWLIEAVAGEASDIGTLVSQVPLSIFRYFGQNLMGIPQIGASYAQVASTWFLTDNLGHLIPAGTQVSIDDASGTPQAFTVLVDVIVPGGATQTGVGQVQLIANTPGVASNNLGIVGGVVDLVDTLAWVDHITQTGPTSNGADAESDDEYLGRLTEELRTMSPRPILPIDFSILARNVPGVQRAVTIDGYNTANATFGNERMVTVVSLDSSGNGVSVPVRTAVQTYLDAKRELNFVVNTMDPQVTVVDVLCNFKVLPGWVISDAQANVVATITDFLSPIKWGIDKQGDDPDLPVTWNNQSIVRYLELAAAIDNTPGVDIITLLQIGPHLGAMASSDLNITGVVPLPNPGTITVVGS